MTKGEERRAGRRDARWPGVAAAGGCGLDLLDVRGLEALGPSGDLELHAVPLGELTEAVRRDGGVVD